MSIAELQHPGVGLPTHLDLPHTDDKPVENFFQPEQGFLLLDVLTPHLDSLHPEGDFIIGMDNGIYWELKPDRLDGCRAPDWFYVPGVPKLLDGQIRKSYVMWHEKVPPLFVAEFVSGNGAEERDATPESGKFWVYERGIKAKYYAIYDPKQGEIEIHQLVRGRYRPLPAESNGRFRIPEMKLEFGTWEGEYQGTPAVWMRAWDLKGRLIPTGQENAARMKQRADAQQQRADAQQQRADAQQQRADAQQQRADAQQQRADAQHQRADAQPERADALARKLRELGIDPDRI
jgi:Uma2 family endonuclease